MPVLAGELELAYKRFHDPAYAWLISLNPARDTYISYGRAGQRKELQPAAPLTIGRYGFLVTDVTKGGRKDVKLGLYYDRVPSLLALKNILPDAFQRVFRLRRSSQRIVS
jgi:hypothetical protein